MSRWVKWGASSVSIWPLMLGVLLFSATFAKADLITGDAGLVRSDMDGFALNPANLGYNNLRQIKANLELVSEEKLLIQYQGQEPISRKNSSFLFRRIFSGGQSSPPFFYVASIPSSRIGFSLVALPPMNLAADFKFGKVPIVLLDSQSYIDLNISDIKLKGYVTGKIGMRLNARWAIGTSLNYISSTSKTNAIETDSGDKLFDLDQDITIIKGSLGVRYEINKQWSIGTVFDLININDIAVSSDLLPPVPRKKLTLKTPADGLALGVRYIRGKYTFWVDSYYKKAEFQEGISLSTVSVKEKDTYPTLAFRSGVKWSLQRNLKLLGGLRIEPSGIGPGGPGADDKSGYGPFEVIQLMTAGEKLSPYNQVSVGVQTQFGKKIHPKSKKKSKKKYFYQTIVNVGAVMREASLGVAQSGEQPAAYLQQSLSIPVSITYRF